MDDDDWYSPDFVADLLLARAYSGAELVGMPDDFYYLEDRDLTGAAGASRARSTAASSPAAPCCSTPACCARLAASGERAPTRRRAAPVRRVRQAGAATYRTHGLGYCLRRTASGHTWAADLDDLESRAVATWPGFRPGRLMEL